MNGLTALLLIPVAVVAFTVFCLGAYWAMGRLYGTERLWLSPSYFLLAMTAALGAIASFVALVYCIIFFAVETGWFR